MTNQISFLSLISETTDRMTSLGKVPVSNPELSFLLSDRNKFKKIE
ncbi:MAG TPA: hypothetical protein PKD83_04400 [Ignavibacteria bacterium]|nr:hypothetical protein [Ignavibacteria bacterium]